VIAMADDPRPHAFTGPNGRRVSYACYGDGRPLVRVPGWLSHPAAFMLQPTERLFAESLAALSPPWMEIAYAVQRPGDAYTRSDFSLDSMVRELAALLDHLQLERAGLVCPSVAAMVGIACTARHPDRVAGLVLVNGSSRGVDFQVAPLMAAFAALTALGADEWAIGREALIQALALDDFSAAFSPPDGGDESPARSVGAVLALWAAYRGFDVTPLLPAITVPSLVIHRRGDRVVPLAAGVQLAAAIPGARFLPTHGQAHALFGETPSEAAEVRRAIVAFLQDDPPGEDPRVPAAVDPPSLASPLTFQQLRVLQLIAQGRTSREIAASLVVSERTVQRHIANLYTKIGVHNRAEATAVALNLARARPRPVAARR